MAEEKTTLRTAALPRRTVLRGAVWAVPVVAAAVAAPLSAASPVACEDKRVELGWKGAALEQHRFADPAQQGQSFTNTAVFAPIPLDPGAQELAPMTVTILHEFHGEARGAIQGGNDYATIGAGQPNGIALAPGYYDVSQRMEGGVVPTAADYSDWTYTFVDGPVRDLQFTIVDVDRTDGQFVDAVSVLSAAPFTATTGAGSSFAGDGSDAAPFYSTVNVNHPYTDPRSHITFSFSQPVQSFTIRYRNLAASNASPLAGLQGVYLASFRFTADVMCETP